MLHKLLLSILLLIWPLSSGAVGTAVSPPELNLVYPDSNNSAISVRNISDEPIIVDVYSDDFGNQINIIPHELVLLPTEVTQVNIEFDFSNEKSGVRQTNISVVSRARNQTSFNAASGLKIPLRININQANYWQWTGASVFIVTFFGLLLLLGLFQVVDYLIRPKSKKVGFNIDLAIHHKRRWWQWFR